MVPIRLVWFHEQWKDVVPIRLVWYHGQWRGMVPIRLVWYHGQWKDVVPISDLVTWTVEGHGTNKTGMVSRTVEGCGTGMVSGTVNGHCTNKTSLACSRQEASPSSRRTSVIIIQHASTLLPNDLSEMPCNMPSTWATDYSQPTILASTATAGLGNWGKGLGWT